MANKVSLSITRHPQQDGVVSTRHITIRKRLLRLMLGKPHHLMLIAPGKDQIYEVKEASHEYNE